MADIKSESRPASNRNQWPASFWNAWPASSETAAIIADLDSLTETEVEQDGKRFLLRSAPRPAASLALSAIGVALPPTLRQVADA